MSSVEDISEESLSLFYTLEPKIGKSLTPYSALSQHTYHCTSQDILVIGVGDNDLKVNPKVIQFMRGKSINLEILPTERACATFNFLNAEGRCVAGALIPPTIMRINEDDLASTQRKNNDFMKTDDEYLFKM